MAISDARPAPRPSPLAVAALLALAACAVQVASSAWHGCLRVDAGERMQVVVETPPPRAEWEDVSEDGGWEGVLEAGGIRVRWELTAMANRDR